MTLGGNGPRPSAVGLGGSDDWATGRTAAFCCEGYGERAEWLSSLTGSQAHFPLAAHGQDESRDYIGTIGAVTVVHMGQVGLSDR